MVAVDDGTDRPRCWAVVVRISPHIATGCTTRVPTHTSPGRSWSRASVRYPKGFSCGPYTSATRTGIALPASFISGRSGRTAGGRNWCVRPSRSRMSPTTGVYSDVLMSWRSSSSVC
nr:hypothetical protein [Tessaracoccus coleopterorum]